ncbi:DEAD/DEAH box helicase [Neobacillus sp. Marseille-QA0830]
MSDFLSLGLSKEVTKNLLTYGIAKPTPIQEQAIPIILEGKDIMARAQTGTGKTFAFVLPILEKINREAEYIQALIVTPTRELALQITEECKKLMANMEGVNVLAVYGGQDVNKQLNQLKTGKQIVVGTPGRLLDHLRRGTIQLSKVAFLVLDEADQMLHIGFLNEVEDIIKETPQSRQTMLFSATIPSEIRQLASKYMHEFEFVQVEKLQRPADSIEQIAIHTTDRAKQATLFTLVESYRPFLAVIFCRTKRRVSKLYNALKEQGFSCDELHGDLSQAKREQVMKRFRDAKIQLLIATDVAARGLDVEGVTHVFNYDIPPDADSYIHRIGRTGRAGMNGMAVTLYSSADRPKLDEIEKELQITIQKQNLGNTTNERDTNLKPKQMTAEAKKAGSDRERPRKSARKGSTQKGTAKNHKPFQDKQSEKRKPSKFDRSGGKPAKSQQRNKKR